MTKENTLSSPTSRISLPTKSGVSIGNARVNGDEQKFDACCEGFVTEVFEIPAMTNAKSHRFVRNTGEMVGIF